jgi:ABC-type lipoprotein export system ATPase subunit
MTETATHLLELTAVTKSFAVDGGQELTVLRGLHLTVDRDDTVAVLGPSGSGKSTLLTLMGALDRPTSGRVLIEGRDVAAASDAELSALRNRRIGFVFQAHHLLPQCTVFENVLVPTLVAGTTPAHEARARALLERGGLKERLGHRPGQLSGGERQRVAVVRALINEPSLVLADEPTGSLDRASAEALGELLVELHRAQGAALVVVTHSERLAERLARRFVLRDGVLEEQGA